MRPTINLPNALTATRIFLVPLLVVVLLTNFEGRLIFGMRKELIGAAIFGLASITDWLDGYLARRRKQVTTLGQMIDPIADKLLTSAAFVSLIQMGLAPAWMVAVIIGRELAVTTLRSIAYARGVVIPASPLGKVKMVAQVVAILALILGEEERLQPLGVLGYVALWVVVATALISAADYYRRFSRIPSKVASFPHGRTRAGRKVVARQLLPATSYRMGAIKSPCGDRHPSRRRPARSRRPPARRRRAPRRLRRAADCAPSAAKAFERPVMSICWSRLSLNTRYRWPRTTPALLPRSIVITLPGAAVWMPSMPVTMCPMLSYCGVEPGSGRAAIMGATNGSR